MGKMILVDIDVLREVSTHISWLPVEEYCQRYSWVLDNAINNAPQNISVIEWHDFAKEKPRYDGGWYLVKASNCNVALMCHWWKGEFYDHDQPVSSSKILGWAERPRFDASENQTA